MAGEFGYGSPEMMQWLLPYIEGMSTKDGKAEYGLQASGVNNIQDLLKLLFDPQMAMMTGSYDPMLMGGVAQQQWQPTPQPIANWAQTDAALQSGDPTIAAVADGIKTGQLNVLEASQMLVDAGYTETAAAHAANQWTTEASDNAQAMSQWEQENAQAQQEFANAPRDDVFSRAGLPSPQEQYQTGYDEMGNFSTNAPIQGDFLQRTTDRGGEADAAMAAYMAKHPDYVSGGVRSNAQNELQQIDAPKNLDGLSPANYARWLKSQEGGVNADKFAGRDTSDGAVTWQELIARQGGGDGTLAPSDGGQAEWDKLLKEQQTADMWNSRGRAHATQKSGSKNPSEGDRLSREAFLAKQGNKQSQMHAVGQTIAMRKAGRSPFQDALMARLMSMQSAGVMG